MATIISGDSRTFNDLLYEPPHPSTLDYIKSSVDRSFSNIINTGTDFMQESRRIYEEFVDSDAMSRVSAVKRSMSTLWDTDCIRHLDTIGDLQWAKPVMRRWIMAEPTVRQMYHDDELEGYYGVYKDAFMDRVGADHYDYRRVTNGIVMDTPDGESYYTTYIEELIPGDRELELEEQVDILKTWYSVTEKLKGRRDPTSRWNASI